MVRSVEERVADFGRIMGVWAHPDDETFMSAGVLATAIANNQQTVCVTATKGEAGVQDESRWPADKLAEIREQEAAESFAILGIGNRRWLDYPDGKCHLISEEEAIRRIEDLIQKYQPDTIITFPPDGITGHLDHQAVSRWTCQAANSGHIPVYFGVDTQESYDLFIRELDKKVNVYFNIDKPTLLKRSQCDVHLELPDEIVDKKIAALRAMKSQMSGMEPLFADERFREVLRHEQFVRSDRTDINWGESYWQKTGKR